MVSISFKSIPPINLLYSYTNLVQSIFASSFSFLDRLLTFSPTPLSLKVDAKCTTLLPIHYQVG